MYDHIQFWVLVQLLAIELQMYSLKRMNLQNI